LSSSLLIPALAALLLTLAVLNNEVVRAIMSLPLVIVLPGYAITAAVFPKGTLGVPERLLFSMGTSLALAILCGLLLNWTPWGFQVGAWLVLLCGTTLLASLVAQIRQRRAHAVARTSAHIGLDVRQGLLLSMAVLLIGAAVWMARTPAPQKGLQGYTMLWMLPDVAGKHAVRLGVRSKEFDTTNYRLRVQVNDQTVREWPSIQLGPNEQWEETIELSMEQLDAGEVEAALYRLDSPGSVYRYVVLRANPEE
jgi:uncharacterized membrane protein